MGPARKWLKWTLKMTNNFIILTTLLEKVQIGLFFKFEIKLSILLNSPSSPFFLLSKLYFYFTGGTKCNVENFRKTFFLQEQLQNLKSSTKFLLLIQTQKPGFSSH